MAILKSTSMFLRKISPNDTSNLGTGPPRRNKAPEPRRTPLQKWSLPNFGTLSSQRSSKYRYTGLAQGSENQPLIRHLGLQEEPGAISNNSSLVNAPDSPILEDDTPQGNARSILHMPLIPLAIAQRRQEIQRRIAEFASSGDAPFAIHPNGLLPLAEAITRNDIRRRKEGFELLEEKKPRRDLAIYKTSENTDGSMAPLLPDGPTSDIASESADDSVYSVSSYGDPSSQVVSSFDQDVLRRPQTSRSYSTLEVLSIRDYLPSHHGNTPIPLSQRTYEDFSLNTSGEVSLLRIAEDELGW